jgi:hypothetical protein
MNVTVKDKINKKSGNFHQTFDFYFFKLTQPLTVSVKGKGGTPDRKPYPLPYDFQKSKQKPEV